MDLFKIPQQTKVIIGTKTETSDLWDVSFSTLSISKQETYHAAFSKHNSFSFLDLRWDLLISRHGEVSIWSLRVPFLPLWCAERKKKLRELGKCPRSGIKSSRIEVFRHRNISRWCLKLHGIWDCYVFNKVVSQRIICL